MPIRIICTSCGKALQVRDEFAGKKVKCPGCGTVLTAGAAATPAAVKPAAAVRAAPKAAARAPAPVHEADEEDADERPVRARGKRAGAGASLLWLWVTLGILVVAGAGVGGYFLFFAPSKQPTTKGNVGPLTQNQGNQGG